MNFEIPYVVACLNRDVQDHLASTLADWVERLNQRLKAQQKALVTYDRAVARRIDGSIEISKSLSAAFSANQLDDDHGLLAPNPLVLNGIQIEFPMAYDSPATLSLMFIQSDEARCDGLAVNVSKALRETTPSFADESELVRSVTAAMSKWMAPKDITGQARRIDRDWVINQPCFFTRLGGEWLARLLAALNSFDPSLRVQETGGGFLPVFESAAATPLDFASEMVALADQYLKVFAEDC